MSGTMAQAAVLRVHADERNRRTVLWHPACHLQTHEGEAFSRVHALIGRPIGHRDRLLTLEDLEPIAEPVAALLLELPQRDLGGQLPDWDALVDQVAWARSRGAAAHLDGARLWAASAGYGRPPMMHVLFEVPTHRFVANARRLADEQGIWVWPEPMPTGDPDVVRCELSVGRATCGVEVDQILTTLRALCD